MRFVVTATVFLMMVAGTALASGIIPNLIYCVADGVPLLLDLYLPAGEGPHPAILFLPGGAWHAGDKIGFFSYATHFSNLGYVCLAVNYRWAPFFTFPAQLEDVCCALDWLGRHAAEYGVDMERLAVVGDSAGGHLAALLALAPAGLGGCDEGAPPVKAVVSLYGPMDLTLYASDPVGALVIADFLGASYEENPELWRRASPIHWVNPDAPPFLLIHGTADTVVPVEHSIAMARALEGAGGVVELLLVPGAGHEFHLLPFSWANLLARSRIQEFLARVLSPSREI